MAFFSVIIPLYNKEENIENTLKSVLRQSFSDFEIVIVNDGSTDKGEEIVRGFNDPRIQLINTTNQGVSSARNTGIQKATGTLIALLDADDYWHANHLEQLYLLYNAFPKSGLYATNYEHYYNKYKIVSPCFEGIPTENWQGIVTDFFRSSLVYRIAWTSAVAVEKSVLEEVGGFKPELTSGEDLDLWIRIALYKTVAFCNTVSARYCLDASNRISHSDTLKNRFPKLDQWTEEEEKNKSLKMFLDMYRAEFGIKHKLAGDNQVFEFYRKTINPENLSIKTRVVMALPVSVLRVLYAFKKYLERRNILISIYN